MPTQRYLTRHLRILCFSALLLKILQASPFHLPWWWAPGIFCRPDRVEENLSPNQHLFSLVLYAFALVFFLCVNSIGGISFTVCRCTGHCWTGGLRLKPPDMAVLGANSSLAKAIAWGEVAEGRHCTYTARNQVVPQGCHGECTVRSCSSLSVFCSLSTTAFLVMSWIVFKAIWVHGGVPSVFAPVCSLGDSWLAACTKTSLSLSKAYLPVKALLNILKIADVSDSYLH